MFRRQGRLVKRVLIVGSGGIGRRHLKGYSLTGRAELAIVEPDAGRRAEAAGLFGITEAYADISEANLSRFDLAVICAPANFHVQLMRICAAAKLPFMVEKPLSVTMDDVEYMLFPRLPGVAEVGWTTSDKRSWDDYKVRLANHAKRWELMGINYYKSPKVPWNSNEGTAE